SIWPAARPAPDSTAAWKPALTSLATVSGISETRCSRGAVSRGMARRTAWESSGVDAAWQCGRRVRVGVECTLARRPPLCGHAARSPYTESRIDPGPARQLQGLDTGVLPRAPAGERSLRRRAAARMGGDGDGVTVSMDPMERTAR